MTSTSTLEPAEQAILALLERFNVRSGDPVSRLQLAKRAAACGMDEIDVQLLTRYYECVEEDQGAFKTARFLGAVIGEKERWSDVLRSARQLSDDQLAGGDGGGVNRRYGDDLQQAQQVDIDYVRERVNVDGKPVELLASQMGWSVETVRRICEEVPA